MVTALCYLVILLIVIELLRALDKSFDLISLVLKLKREKDRMLNGLIITDHLHYLTPIEFETWCREFLVKIGYSEVQVTPPRADGGKDIICNKGGKKYYVECKRYSRSAFAPYKVDEEIVKKLVGAIVHDKADCGIIITTGRVKQNAYNYADKVSSRYLIEIIDGDSLEQEYSGLTPSEA